MASDDIRTMLFGPRRASRRVSIRNYSMNLALVYWEMTQACPLACKHCRAEAIS
jgi:MoaA/NifB/PqqE/SkfB family radical SAM enzyme